MKAHIRAATRPSDSGFLRQMLAAAAGWRGGAGDRSALEDPEIAVYVDNWGRAGDVALIAEDDAGRPLGAAWYRHFSEDEHGFGFLDPEVPELSIAVAPEHRGRGLGTLLLGALIDRAEQEGLALSLSVEDGNPAVRLYERNRFEKVTRVGGAWTMRRDLS